MWYQWLCIVILIHCKAQNDISVQTSIKKQQLPGFSPYWQIPEADEHLHIYGLPVGQGDYTVIQCPKIDGNGGEVVIFDGGSKKFQDAGNEAVAWNREKVIQFLLPQIKNIKGIIVSHPDEDHYNYIRSISTFTESQTIQQAIKYYGYTDFHTQITPPNLNNAILIAGGNLSWYNNAFYYDVYNVFNIKQNMDYICVINGNDDLEITACPSLQTPCSAAAGTSIEFLAANIGSDWPNLSKDIYSNTGSIILKVSYNEQSIILPGDYETECSWDLLRSYIGNEILQTTVFHVSHHGSTHSFPPWRYPQTVMESKYSLISGYSPNGHGHPTCTTMWALQNWYEQDLQIERTSIDGATTQNPLVCFNPSPPSSYEAEPFDAPQFPYSQLVNGDRCQVVDIIFTSNNQPQINEIEVDCELQIKGCVFVGPFYGMNINSEPLQIALGLPAQTYENVGDALADCQSDESSNCGGVTCTISTSTFPPKQRCKLYRKKNTKPRLKLASNLEFYNPVTRVRSWYRSTLNSRRRMADDNDDDECIVCNVNNEPCQVTYNLNKLTVVTIIPSTNALITPTTVCLFPFRIDDGNIIYSDFIEWNDKMNMYWINMYVDNSNNTELRLFGSSTMCNDTLCNMKTMTWTNIGEQYNGDDNTMSLEVFPPSSNETIGEHAKYNILFGESTTTCSCYEIRDKEAAKSSIISIENSINNTFSCQLLCFNNEKCKYFQYIPQTMVCTLLSNNTLGEGTSTNIFGRNTCATDAPTNSPTNAPSASPTAHPTDEPSPKPTPKPTERPESEDDPDLPDVPPLPIWCPVIIIPFLPPIVIIPPPVPPFGSPPTNQPTLHPSFSPIYNDETKRPTNSPTKPPTVYHDNAIICFEDNSVYNELNGEYAYYTWNYTANGPVYYNKNNEYYLFPYLYEMDEGVLGVYYIYNISMCIVGYIQEDETFNPDQCIYWYNYVDDFYNFTMDTQFNGYYCTEQDTLPPANVCLKNNSVYNQIDGINGGYESRGIPPTPPP